MAVFVDSNIPMYVVGRDHPLRDPERRFLERVTLADTDKAKDLACGPPVVGVRDAVHAAVMLNNDVRLIATFDSRFDRIAGAERLSLA